jgi:hypothetical protein
MSPPAEKFAVILIDAVPTDPCYVPDLVTELDKMAAVLSRANMLNIPVFEVRSCSNDLFIGRTCTVTNPQLTVFSASNWQVVEKLGFDAFKETDLEQRLTDEGITSLIVMGYHEAVCVRFTIESALQTGFMVYTSMDVVQGPKYDPYDSSDERTKKEVKRFYNESPILVDNYLELPIF